MLFFGYLMLFFGKFSLKLLYNTSVFMSNSICGKFGKFTVKIRIEAHFC